MRARRSRAPPRTSLLRQSTPSLYRSAARNRCPAATGSLTGIPGTDPGADRLRPGAAAFTPAATARRTDLPAARPGTDLSRTPTMRSGASSRPERPRRSGRPATRALDADTLLHLDHLKKYFPIRNAWKRRTGWLKALDDVSLTSERARSSASSARAGCGKSTLGKTIMGIHSPTGGRIVFDGQRHHRPETASEPGHAAGSPVHLSGPRAPRSTRAGRSASRWTSRW